MNPLRYGGTMVLGVVATLLLVGAPSRSGACPPPTVIELAKTVSPEVVPVNLSTRVVYEITARNAGPYVAENLEVLDPVPPSFLADAESSVFVDRPGASITILETMPPRVRVSRLPVGATLTLLVTGVVTPGCEDAPVTNVVQARGDNVAELTAAVALAVNADGPEVCDGVDNDCNGLADESGDALCTDGDACNGVEHCAGAAGCVAGTPPACDDGDPCTADACATDGTCVHAPLPDCPACVPTAEVCGNGRDDDCDGLVDCADPDCATDPLCRPPVEICGNCIDDDGDGLTDYEDPDCCTAGTPLVVKRLRLVARPAKHGVTRLRLRIGDTGFPAAGFDACAADTTLQVSDTTGPLLCRTVPAERWTEPRRRLFSFRDPSGAVAGGLRRSTFKVKRSGAIAFHVRGRELPLRPVDGDTVNLTVRVGDRCARATLPVRAARGYVFP